MDKKPNKSAKEGNGCKSPEQANQQSAVRETMTSRIQRRARSLASSAPGRAISRIAQGVRNLGQRRRGQSAPPRPPPQAPPIPDNNIRQGRLPQRRQRIECVRNSVSPSPSRSPPKRVDTPEALRPGSSNGKTPEKKK